jgi:hypothetical protein
VTQKINFARLQLEDMSLPPMTSLRRTVQPNARS